MDAIIYSRCDAGYTGQHCEKKDYSVLYVVPGPVRFQYVLIAAVIGTIQIAVICVVVLCITRSVTILSGHPHKGIHHSSLSESDHSNFKSLCGLRNHPFSGVLFLHHNIWITKWKDNDFHAGVVQIIFLIFAFWWGLFIF